MSKLLRLKSAIDVRVNDRMVTVAANTKVNILGVANGIMLVSCPSIADVSFEVAARNLFAPRGQLVSIYRPADGCDYSLGGISSQFTMAVLCGHGIAEITEETEDLPALRTALSFVLFDRYLFAVPYEIAEPAGTVMFGGNFCYSSDSRISNLSQPYGTIPIHDRLVSRQKRCYAREEAKNAHD